MSLEERLQNDLGKRKINGNLRKLSLQDSLIDFVSNDYLGLARSEQLHGAIYKEIEKYSSNGSTGSRLLSGNSALALEVEEKLSYYLDSESALIYNSGYTANLGVLSSIPKRGDTVLYDEFSHACIKDGIRLSMASRYSFRHNDLNDLEAKLKKATGNVFVVAESVYSMDGDQCPIEEMVSIADRYDANIIIDEAHGTGVMGKNGQGLSGMFTDKIFCRIYTFGKAMGTHGAAVVGSDSLTQYLINFSRPFIYTTAPTPHGLISIWKAFEFLVDNIELQNKISHKVDFFIREYESRLVEKVNRINSIHPIQALIIPGNKRVKSIANALNNDGFDIRPILSPTVKEGQERLRVCLHTYNSEDEISQLIKKLESLV